MLLSKIPSQRFELIRDAIGRVLTAEFANQKTLGTIGFDINIFVERAMPLDNSELPVINILLADVEFTEELNSYNSLGDCKFLIELYTNGTTDQNESGDVKAGILLAKIAGMVRAILMNNRNLYLDFSDKFIQTRKIKSFSRTQPRIAGDAANTISGVIEAHYYAEETTELQTGTVETFLSTVVKLYDTNKGYKFEISNT
jgi:hypothetical protein